MTKAIFETFIAMEPVAKGRPRVTSFGTFTPTKTKDAEARIQMQVALEYKGAPLEEPLTVCVTVHLQKPTSRSKTKASYPTTKPDVDNYVKLVLDALNGILWKDDSSVVSMCVTKRYSERQGIYLTVRGIGAVQPLANKRMPVDSEPWADYRVALGG